MSGKNDQGSTPKRQKKRPVSTTPLRPTPKSTLIREETHTTTDTSTDEEPNTIEEGQEIN